MAIRTTKRQKDKYGNVWLRDNYGGWTNEFGVRFTKTEHRRFGYTIRKANKKIADYQAKYPSTRVSKATDVGSRFRNADLSRFRRKSAYKRYLAVTERIITGEQLYIKMPRQYAKNMFKALKSPEFVQTANKMGLSSLVNRVMEKLSDLSETELIELSKDSRTPDINAYYIKLGDVQKSNLERLEEVIDKVVEERKK